MLTALTVLLTLCYPFAIWLCHGHIEPRVLALILVVTVLIRLPIIKINGPESGWLVLALVLAIFAMSFNTLIPLQLYPVFINLGMLVVFSYSLFFSTPIIERIARLREPDLPAAAIKYTRHVTQVWCIFFIINGSISLFTVLYASPDVWFIYNGIVAYLLIALLFCIEYLVRLRFKRRHPV